MSNELPATTNIRPDEPVVTFTMHECRQCGERSGWYRDDHDDLATAHEWAVAHGRSTAHRSYYTWTITRGTARVFWT